MLRVLNIWRLQTMTVRYPNHDRMRIEYYKGWFTGRTYVTRVEWLPPL